MKNIGLFLLTVITSLSISAQAADGDIIKLQDPQKVRHYELTQNVELKAISADLGLYQIKHKQDTRTRSLQLAAESEAIYTVPNHKVTLRTTTSRPISTDPLWDEQWNMRLDSESVGINAESTWRRFGSRSYDKSYNDIVIAVVDGGFDIDHPDLVYNKWRNRGEIAGNGVDDDGNGYIDDINGWDISSDSGTIYKADHGTHVAGVIGARGNNRRGIAGVNWRTKIMYVSSGNLGDTASTMRAYSYILKQKKLWLESFGRKGANVVAINSSFGIDGAQCSLPEFRVWNDMIDELGKVGILSIAATSNFEVNVDVNGDIPTSCESPFLIAVTNSNRDGSKATGKEWNTISQPSFLNLGAGFGPNHIDIAAPGDEILSTAVRVSTDESRFYTAQSGTSFSTPHVAGAVGYLHSVAPWTFNRKYLQDPASAALDLKNVLLETVTPIESMRNVTKSAGVLNLLDASLELQTQSLFMASSH